MPFLSTLKQHPFLLISCSVSSIIGIYGLYHAVVALFGKSDRATIAGSRPSTPQTPHEYSSRRMQILLDLEKSFRVSRAELETVACAFVSELELGLLRSLTQDERSSGVKLLYEQHSKQIDNPSELDKDRKPDVKFDMLASTLPMLPSFVTALPAGDERGVFLALDFGGTNVRVIKVVLGGPDEDNEGSSDHSLADKLDRGAKKIFQHKPKSSVGKRGGRYTVAQSKASIPPELKHGSGYDLFDFLAKCVKEFLDNHPLDEDIADDIMVRPTSKGKKGSGSQKQTRAVPLGFTFSFSINQTKINEGTIINWNKDFDCADVVGKDPIALLQNALTKTGVTNVNVNALVNDTIGTLIAHSFEDEQTRIGVILGTGANACYVEQQKNIKKQSTNLRADRQLINIEFGAFHPDFHRIDKGSDSLPSQSSWPYILPRTSFDFKVDLNSKNPGTQLFEKLISGFYLGEILRYVMLDLAVRGQIFTQATYQPYSQEQWDKKRRQNNAGLTNLTKESKLTAPVGEEPDLINRFGVLAKQYSFDTVYMSRIERDHSSELSDTKSVLEDIFGIYDSTLADRQLVKFTSEMIAIRSSRLAASSIAGILAHMGLCRLLCHQKDSTTHLAHMVERHVESYVSDSTKDAVPLKGQGSQSSVGLPLGHEQVTVAIDGSLFEHYPHYANRMMDALRELLGSRADAIQLSLARDGSGLGAALIAALVDKQVREETSKK